MKRKTVRRSAKRKPARKAGRPGWMPFPDDAVDDATLLVWVSEEDERVGLVADLPPSLKGMSSLVVEGGRKYDLRRMVATGGMGVVYEGVDIHCDRTVAVKLLLSDEKHLEENRRRFMTEVQITSKLEHPNIVPVYEVGKDVVGNTFYTMKYVKGLTLGKVLNSLRQGDADTVRQFPLGRLLTIFQKVCDAVAFAHGHGVVHRDLKPGNIMLGDYGEVLVLDWGLARRMEPGKPGQELPARRARPDLKALQDYDGRRLDTIRVDTAGTGLKTIKGTILGTPGFIAPEQVHKQGVVDQRTDVYSLGAILYSILTLRSPIREKSIHKLLRRILTGEILPPAEYNRKVLSGEIPAFAHCPNGQIPEALSAIAMCAMATAPSDRYNAVQDLQQEIEDYQNGLVWQLVLDDDFSKPEAWEHWELRCGTFEAKDGELRLQGGEPQMLLLKTDVPLDVRLEFECHEEGAYLNDVGCLLSGIRSASDWETSISGYAFKYGAYTNTLNVVTRCNERIWSERATPLAPGRRYVVRAERVGSRLRWFVNNQLVCSLADPEPLTGASRSLIGLLGWVADTRYSRVKVYTLGTPWKSDVLDMAERHFTRGNYQTAMDLFAETMKSFPDAQRLERARAGYERARNRNELLTHLPAWKEKLREAWPGVPVKILVDNDGLKVEFPPAAGITDLTPLRGMPVTVLVCWSNRVTSLEPLRGMPLIHLNMAGNPLRDLEPLRGMLLVELHCGSCGIRSVEPLRRMQLSVLSIGENPLGGDLAPLKGMPLKWLSVSCTGARNLDPLRGMPLAALACDVNEVTSLEPLRGMPLTEFSCRSNRITDLSPLTGGKLNTLHCSENRIRSLEPLRGMPLSTFTCPSNAIESIEPLYGMPLSCLRCGANHLHDIGPFIRNPPKTFSFDCDTISTQELEFMRDKWSRDFRYAGYVRDLEVLLALRRSDVPALKKLASEFRGHQYLFVPKFLGWEDAEALCRKLGGHLVSITSKEENEFVVSMFPFGGTWLWIGLNVRESGPEWVTGEPFGFDATVSVMHETVPGPRILSGRNWCHEIVPGAHNAFVIEWDRP